ncbi:MAG: hypothetical protein HZC28_02515 [Spirochaetes bacterium]|nr:hypothetical protein [Spirochaetota bacterium]
MELDIVRVRFHYHIGRFRYNITEPFAIGDTCIVNTEEGQDYGTVVSFTKVEDAPPEALVFFDEQGTVQGDGKGNDIHDDVDEDSRDHRHAPANRKQQTRAKNDPHKIYEVVRKANAEDLKRNKENEELEKQAFKECRERIEHHKLDMKLISAHYYFDRSKLLFEFIAEHRVDFRDLVKDLAGHFRTRIDLRQIGVRDEAKIIGGCGVCGRDLCCNRMKGDFEAISIKMAREQNLSLNTAKISGLCGRLMCCLSYEYHTYCEIKKGLPRQGDRIIFNETPAEIRDVNPLSRKVLIQTEDKRMLYIKVDDIKKTSDGRSVVTMEVTKE